MTSHQKRRSTHFIVSKKPRSSVVSPLFVNVPPVIQVAPVTEDLLTRPELPDADALRERLVEIGKDPDLKDSLNIMFAKIIKQRYPDYLEMVEAG